MEPSHWSERGLRDAVLAGDQEAWRELYSRHFRALYAFVYWRTTGDREETDDVIQECWLVAVRRIARFDPERGSFEAWLRGIAENVLRNRRRSAARRQSEQRYDTEPAAAEETPRAERRELLERIAAALAILPGNYQYVLRAKYAEEQSVAEIAKGLRLTEKAAESLLGRARAAFARKWKTAEWKHGSEPDENR